MPRTIRKPKDESFDRLLKILDSEKPVSPSTRQKLKMEKGEVRDVTDPERLLVAKILEKMERRRKYNGSGFDFTVAESRMNWFKENVEESGWFCEPIQEATAWLEVEKKKRDTSPKRSLLFNYESIYHGLKDIYHYLMNFIREDTQEKIDITPESAQKIKGWGNARFDSVFDSAMNKEESKKRIIGYMVGDLVMDDFFDSDIIATVTFSVAQTKRNLTMRTLLSGPDRDYANINTLSRRL